MARPPSVAGARPVVIGSRFSQREADRIDKVRGSLSRAEYLRWVVLKATKEQP